MSSPPTHPSPLPRHSDTRGLHLPASTDPPSETNPSKPKVWLIYGATGHVGRSLVKAVLAHHDHVTAVGWLGENSLQQMQHWHAECQGLLCDVRIRETVEEVLKATIERWGRVDVVVNCSGYGVIGACEDQDEYDLRSQVETNFMGTLNVIQVSLPYFRERAAARSSEAEGAGRYIIFSSVSGALGVPGLGPYCATKYAVEGLIESLHYEIDTFGIKATLVEPSHMRLDDTLDMNGKNGKDDNKQDEKDGVKLNKYGHFLVKQPSQPYDTPTAPANHTRRVVQWLIDRQPTSAVKSAELVWQLGHCRYPPLRLLLGAYAIDSVRDRLRSITEEIEDWKHLSFQATDGVGGDRRPGEDERDRDDEVDESELDVDVHAGDGT